MDKEELKNKMEKLSSQLEWAMAQADRLAAARSPGGVREYEEWIEEEARLRPLFRAAFKAWWDCPWPTN